MEVCMTVPQAGHPWSLLAKLMDILYTLRLQTQVRLLQTYSFGVDADEMGIPNFRKFS